MELGGGSSTTVSICRQFTEDAFTRSTASRPHDSVAAGTSIVYSRFTVYTLHIWRDRQERFW